MKTHLISGLFFLLFLPALKAQTDFRFADSTAQWNVLTTQFIPSQHGDFLYGTRIFGITGDTLINGFNYQVINDTVYYIRQDTLGKVFVLSDFDGVENFVCDFGRQTGDTVKLTSRYGSPTVSFVVDSVDTINLLYPRKRMFVSAQPYNSIFKDVWIEGIGNTNNLFLDPMAQFSCCDGPSNVLLCFFERDSMLFHDNSLTASCVFDSSTLTGITEFAGGILVKILPNPAQNAITIQSETSFPVQTNFQLFDITGRMILQKPLYEKVSSVELQGVLRGMYLYSIVSPQQKIISGKLVVQ